MTLPNPEIRELDFAPGQELGEYVVEAALGVGGMATVLAVRHRPTDSQLAMKVLRSVQALDPEFCQRFLREASTASQLRDEHIVRVWESGVLDSGHPYMVMERLSGNDLSIELSARGPLPIELVLEVGLQAASALAEAHALGIVHRDLKPANLFLDHSPDGKAMIKILDFGISKAAPGKGPELTATEVMLGTPGYMPPEQMRNSKTVDPRADIWSLGVTLFELLTGAMPFARESMGELINAVLFHPPNDIRELRADVPLALARIIEKCLAKDPDQRYSTVTELAHELRTLEGVYCTSWDDDEPTRLFYSEPPPSPPPVSANPAPLSPRTVFLTASVVFLVAMVSTLLLAFHAHWLTSIQNFHAQSNDSGISLVSCITSAK